MFDLVEVNEVLVMVCDVVEQVNLFKSLFLVNMSYEIRMLMNVIVGLIYLLCKEFFDVWYLEWLEKIEGVVSYLLLIINDVLDILKIEVGKLYFESIIFLLDKVFDGVCSMIVECVCVKGVELVWDVVFELVGSFFGD